MAPKKKPEVSKDQESFLTLVPAVSADVPETRGANGKTVKKHRDVPLTTPEERRIMKQTPQVRISAEIGASDWTDQDH